MDPIYRPAFVGEVRAFGVNQDAVHGHAIHGAAERGSAARTKAGTDFCVA